MPTPSIAVVAAGLILRAPTGLAIAPTVLVEPATGPYSYVYLVPIGGSIAVPADELPATVVWSWRTEGIADPAPVEVACCTDIGQNGDCGTDQDIEAWFALYETLDPRADYNGDGVVDSEDEAALFEALAG